MVCENFVELIWKYVVFKMIFMPACFTFYPYCPNRLHFPFTPSTRPRCKTEANKGPDCGSYPQDSKHTRPLHIRPTPFWGRGARGCLPSYMSIAPLFHVSRRGDGGPHDRRKSAGSSAFLISPS